MRYYLILPLLILFAGCTEADMSTPPSSPIPPPSKDCREQARDRLDLYNKPDIEPLSEKEKINALSALYDECMRERDGYRYVVDFRNAKTGGGCDAAGHCPSGETSTVTGNQPTNQPVSPVSVTVINQPGYGQYAQPPGNNAPAAQATATPPAESEQNHPIQKPASAEETEKARMPVANAEEKKTPVGQPRTEPPQQQPVSVTINNKAYPLPEKEEARTATAAEQSQASTPASAQTPAHQATAVPVQPVSVNNQPSITRPQQVSEQRHPAELVSPPPQYPSINITGQPGAQPAQPAPASSVAHYQAAPGSAPAAADKPSSTTINNHPEFRMAQQPSERSAQPSSPTQPFASATSQPNIQLTQPAPSPATAHYHAATPSVAPTSINNQPEFRLAQQPSERAAQAASPIQPSASVVNQPSIQPGQPASSSVHYHAAPGAQSSERIIQMPGSSQPSSAYAVSQPPAPSSSSVHYQATAPAAAPTTINNRPEFKLAQQPPEHITERALQAPSSLQPSSASVTSQPEFRLAQQPSEHAAQAASPAPSSATAAATSNPQFRLSQTPATPAPSVSSNSQPNIHMAQPAVPAPSATASSQPQLKLNPPEQPPGSHPVQHNQPNITVPHETTVASKVTAASPVKLEEHIKAKPHAKLSSVKKRKATPEEIARRPMRVIHPKAAPRKLAHNKVRKPQSQAKKNRAKPLTPADKQLEILLAE